jgi:hypothetical protein
LESIVAPNGSSAGGNSLLNRLPWRTSVFIDTGYDNPIEPVVNIARGHQVSHRRLQGFVPAWSIIPIYMKSKDVAREDRVSLTGA